MPGHDDINKQDAQKAAAVVVSAGVGVGAVVGAVTNDSRLGTLAAIVGSAFTAWGLSKVGEGSQDSVGRAMHGLFKPADPVSDFVHNAVNGGAKVVDDLTARPK